MPSISLNTPLARENPPLIEIYTKDYCPYCDRALELIQTKHADIVVIDLGQFPERIPEMIQRAHGRKTVPQIFVNHQYIGGCDDLYRMQASGDLDNFFKNNTGV